MASRYTPTVAKRGYNRDTIRGGASDWDVSRPFSSYLRLLAQLLVHPVRFFEVLPRVPDLRAPGLFLAFSGLLSAPIWLIFDGIIPAIFALVLPLPLSFAIAGLCHAGTIGGRYGYRVTWRTVAYPLGFALPLAGVPGLRWVAVAYAGIVLLPVGLATVREISTVRAAPVPVIVTALLLFCLWWFL
ncbi:hypothetical protein BH18ACT10_BH18ACT10_15280 [soil metagenome]